jgi:predicted type IV restriction endonuclease
MIRMDFIDKIHDIGSHIPDQKEHIKTEEATKMALVLPFLSALGYNVFDPSEVKPEHTMNIGGKKDEKVDYAIFKDGKAVILIECKSCGSDLNEVTFSQLKKYFAFTEAKFGILTDGIIYRFYSDLDDINKMDDEPFLELDMLHIKDPIVAEIKNFSKPMNNDVAHDRAEDLKYMRKIREKLESEFNSPSDDFVKLFASKVYKGHIRKGVADKFKDYTKKTCDQFIQDKIDEVVNAAKDRVLSPPPTTPQIQELPPEPQITPKYYIFEGQKKEVKFWKDMLAEICGIMASRHEDRFEDIFTIRGDKNIYFSRNKDELKSPEPIEGTDVYVETAFGKEMLFKIAGKVVALFDYSEDSISYE